MSDIMKNWQRKDSRSSFSRISESVKKPEPLRERLSFTVYKLRNQERQLDQAYQRMQNHYSELFRKCTNAVLSKDAARASMYANECAEIKKMSQTILRSQFAIEQLALRLETVQEFGDVMAEMGPVAGVINVIKGPLAGVLPQVSMQLGEVGDSLNDLVMESGGATDASWNVMSSGEESEKILSEANIIAEQKIKDTFPTLPDTGIPHLEKVPTNRRP